MVKRSSVVEKKNEERGKERDERSGVKIAFMFHPLPIHPHRPRER